MWLCGCSKMQGSEQSRSRSTLNVPDNSTNDWSTEYRNAKYMIASSNVTQNHLEGVAQVMHPHVCLSIFSVERGAVIGRVRLAVGL